MAPELTPTEELAAVFARMSGLLLSQETVHSGLAVIAALAAETIPGTAGAGVTLLERDGRTTTSGATDQVAAEADRLQYDMDEGPCLRAWRERHLVRVDDLTTDERFPRWCPAAAALGIRSTLSVPLVAGDESMGAIKVYSLRPRAFDPRAEHLLTMFASPAAALLANIRSLDNARQLSESLKRALRERDVTTMAKGVLMERDGVGEEQAFAMLVSLSRREGRPVREVAEQLVSSARRRV